MVRTSVRRGTPSNSKLLFAGGGLSSSLAAYRLVQRHPEIDLRVVEQGPALGGNHTWSFHRGDLSAEEHGWMRPFVSYEWPRYEVRFPAYRRIIESAYYTVESERLHAVVSHALGDRVSLGARCGDLTAASHDGCVTIDGRGFHPSDALGLAYQKFVGRVVEFERDIDIRHPILMDATVDQRDGFRFMYVLPFSQRTALIEDTYYSDSPDIDTRALQARIAEYAERQGWTVAGVLREERGVLPVTLDGDIDAFWNERPAVARVGLAAALYHPTTGYSLPDAVRTAELLADWYDRVELDAYSLLRRHSVERWNATGFYRMLNRMLFHAAQPALRYRVLERFYSLPEALIARFYAGQLTWIDRARLLVGKPPVPLHAALRAVRTSSASRAAAAGTS